MTDERNEENEPVKELEVPTSVPEKSKKVANVASLSKRADEQEKQIIALSNKVSDVSANMESGFASILKAINNPVMREHGGTDVRDVYHGEDNGAVNFGVDGQGDVTLERSRMASIYDPEFKEKMDQMKFDQEKIEILIQPSTERWADNSVFISVNGRAIYLIRGVKIWVPRNYCEVLARARVSNYGNREIVDQSGQRTVANEETRAHRIVFQVCTDRNPLGPHWLERVTNERTMGMRR